MTVITPTLSPAELHPAGSCASCGGTGAGVDALPGFQAAMVGTYRAGIGAGHEDAIAHLRQLIAETWHDLNVDRRLRDRCNREDPARFAWDRVAVVRTGVLRQLFAIRRALKEATR